MARNGNDRAIAWGLASGLLFLVAATFFAAAVTVDGDAARTCAALGSLFGLLGAASMYVTFAAYFEFWPY